VLVAAAATSVLALDASRDLRREAERVNSISIDADHVLDLVVAAEAGERGYLLTGRDTYLVPYRTAVRDLPEPLHRLLGLTADDPRQLARARELDRLVRLRMAQLTEVVGLARGGDAAAAGRVVNDERARTTMAQLRVLDTQLAQAAEARAMAHDRRSAQIARVAGVVESVACVLLLGLLVVMLRLLRQRRRTEAARLAGEQERADLAGELSHLTHHDALTGLPNRRLLEDRITQALVRSQRDGTLTAVLYVDLDRFKNVNDTLGHSVGDEVLAQTARRLRSQLRTTDTLARVGGEEFVALCEGLRTGEEADRLGLSLQDQLAKGFLAEQRRVRVTASVGLVVAEHDRLHGEREARPITPETLISAAEAAMYQAKDTGRARPYRYTGHDAGRRSDRAALLLDLESALKNKELWVAYQPLVDLDGEQPVGVEALLRWDHPVRGSVPPATFIPLAEESGLIVPIGTYVLRAACAQVARWNVVRRQQGLPPLHASVNCSARQLLDDRFLLTLAETLAATRITPQLVTIEITEGVLVDSVSGAADRLHELAATGVVLSLDDFGTGYSSLSYLRRFPVDLIKIDRSFISGLGRSDADEAIIAAVVSLANRLGRRVLAEGVETAEQAAHVRRLGCHLAQGYLYGRPARAERLGVLLAGPVVVGR
jgi:diguanylate cyclase (GGDEF)-like protein